MNHYAYLRDNHHQKCLILTLIRAKLARLELKLPMQGSGVVPEVHTLIVW